MFCRVTLAEFLPEKADEGFAVVRDSVLPTIKEQHGFQGLMLLRDPITGSATMVTLWEAEADMEMSASGNYPTQVAKLQPFLARPPSRVIYEVAELSL
jgi:hypothetical protein